MGVIELLLGFLLVFSSSLMIISRRISEFLFSFFFTLFLTGLIYLLHGLTLVGFSQILVYIGAILIAFLFGLMVLDFTKFFEDIDVNVKGLFSGLIVPASFIIVFLYLTREPILTEKLPPTTPFPESVKLAGEDIFITYGLVFEALSFLLLVAFLLGVIFLRREK